MKLVTPVGQKYILPYKYTLEQRERLVGLILKRKKNGVPLETFLQQHFSTSHQCRVCLDKLSTYLTQAREFRVHQSNPREDKECLSRDKFKRMIRGDERVSHFEGMPVHERARYLDVSEQYEEE